MTSRLERLFLLLETGQSTFLRKSAAYQIGEIVKTHPHELGRLLEKLKSLVTNSSWETRIAAAQTIESIVKHLSDFDLAIIPSSNADLKSTSNGDFINIIYSKLSDFNLNNLLMSSAKLLSSNTHKYDLKEVDELNQINNNGNGKSNNSTINNDLLNEKIKQQRKLLNQKLGIDVGDAAKLDTQHIFSDYDLIVSNQLLSLDNSTSEITAASSLKRKAAVSEVDNSKMLSCLNVSATTSSNTNIKQESSVFDVYENEVFVKNESIDQTPMVKILIHCNWGSNKIKPVNFKPDSKIEFFQFFDNI